MKMSIYLPTAELETVPSDDPKKRLGSSTETGPPSITLFTCTPRRCSSAVIRR
jgi:hypothetical protein